MSLGVITLYLWTFLQASPPLAVAFNVSLPAAILAASNILICIILYFWVPGKKYFPASLLVYLLLSATAAVLIIQTGNLSSPFIPLWMLISIFAGVFGPFGAIPILLALGTFIANRYINGNFLINEIVTTTISGILPLFAGIIVWYNRQNKDASATETRNYRSLANELTEVANKSEVVINAIGDGVMAIDGQGNIQLINPAAQNIIGWGKQDALNLNYKSVLQLIDQKNDTPDDANDPIRQVLNVNQQIRTNNMSVLTSSGKKLMISLVVSPVGDLGAGVIAVFRDITSEKASEREQAEFISTASHEMRTPVAAIEGYLGLALNPQTASIDIRARDFILKAHASADHLGHLFQDLLDVSKADDGRISNNPKVVNIIELTHDIVQGLSQKATDKGLRITFKPIPDDRSGRVIPPVYYVNLDNDHVREILDNLIENAIKYTPRGEVVVDADGDDDHVIISIKDSGIGIPAEDMSHLFQKFYRVDNKDTREIGGTGLGLYLSRRLAEIMGGRIWAESVYQKGTTFFVELPRISSTEANNLIDQSALIDQEKANQAVITRPQQIATSPIQDVIAPTQSSNVPRGQALTPEQIAAYVAKQRALVAQQQAMQPQATLQPQQYQQIQYAQPQQVMPPRTMQPVVNAGQRPQATISIPTRIPQQ